MEAHADLLRLDHKSGYGLTERKIGWEVTFALRRTAEGRGFGRVSFTFSPSYHFAGFGFGCLFVFGFWFCFLLVFSGTQVFCNHCMSSSHTRETLTDKATCSIG